MTDEYYYDQTNKAKPSCPCECCGGNQMTGKKTGQNCFISCAGK